MCHHPSVSLNKEKVSRVISENKIAVCEKTQGLNSACSTDSVSSRKNISVPRHALRFLGTFQGHSKRSIRYIFALLINNKHMQSSLIFILIGNLPNSSLLRRRC